MSRPLVHLQLGASVAARKGFLQGQADGFQLLDRLVCQFSRMPVARLSVLPELQVGPELNGGSGPR